MPDINVIVQPSESIGVSVAPNETNVILESYSSIIWENILNKPTGFQPLSHEHNIYVQSGQLLITSGYLQSLISSSVAGVASINGLTGTVLLSGVGTNTVYYNGNTILISGAASGGNSSGSSVFVTGLSISDPDFIGAGNVLVFAQGNSVYISGTGNLNNFLTRNETGIFAGYNYVNDTFAAKQDTGNFLSKTETGGFASVFNLFQTGQKIDHLSGYVDNTFARKQDTGNFVSRTETGHLNRLTVSGAYRSSYDLTGLGTVSVILSGEKIFVSGASQSGVVGDFVFRSETGQFASDSDLLYASGYLVSLISASSAGVASLAGLSGVIGLTAAGNITITTGIGNITVSGATGQLISIYQTGDFATAFNLVQSGRYLDNKINSESGWALATFALKQDTGNFVSQTQTGHLSRLTVSGVFSSSWDISGIGGTVVFASGDRVLVSGGSVQTGVVGDWVFRNETGAFATAFNLFLTGQKIDQLSGYLNSSFALKQDTGNFVSQTQTGGLASLLNLFLTGQLVVTTGSERYFNTSVPTGVDSLLVTWSPNFANIPNMIQVTLEITGNILYDVNIRNRTISGYTAVFSDTITESGILLHTLAKI